MTHGHTGYCKGCRCDVCVEARSTYSREWERERSHGRLRTIDARETRDHLRRLEHGGLSMRAIERITGKADSTLRGLRDGRHQRTHPETAEAVLCVTLGDVPDSPSRVSSRVCRLLIAEMRRVLRKRDIEAALRLGRGTPLPGERCTVVSATNHRRICVLYELLARQGIVPASVLD